MRLFCCVQIPEDIRLELYDLRLPIPQVRWVPLENFHLTLQFIGEVSRRQLPTLKHALRKVIFSPFDLEIQGIGHFGEKHGARVLWAGIQNDQAMALTQLRKKIRKAIYLQGEEEDQNWHLENRKFSPHVTLGRGAEIIPYPAVADFIMIHSLFKSRSFRVSSFSLVESVLGTRGKSPMYFEEEQFHLPDERSGIALNL